MHQIGDEIYTHSVEKPSDSNDEDLPKNIVRIKASRLRMDKGFEVETFRDLVRCVAELGYLNPQFNILFRGQDIDYRNKKYGSIIYPSIFRTGEKLQEVRFNQLDENYKKLKRNSKIISLKKQNISSRVSILSYPEFYYALLQHYEKNKTPLIDLTQSLRVAATFALRESEESDTSGYVFVFGMPYPHGSISHFIDQDMVLVKLQNVCPPNALRPHYQEGYLAGNFPFNSNLRAGDNLARRLIGKYKLINFDGSFWDREFKPIPEEVLFPEDDPFHEKLNKILDKEHIGKNQRNIR
ncbi:FRG domain protein [uncultured archaeon]|nr:FRG domain protein [uncultured archaeon]